MRVQVMHEDGEGAIYDAVEVRFYGEVVVSPAIGGLWISQPEQQENAEPRED
jgi:hypothetical protein